MQTKIFSLRLSPFFLISDSNNNFLTLTQLEKNLMLQNIAEALKPPTTLFLPPYYISDHTCVSSSIASWLLSEGSCLLLSSYTFYLEHLCLSGQLFLLFTFRYHLRPNPFLPSSDALPGNKGSNGAALLITFSCLYFPFCVLLPSYLMLDGKSSHQWSCLHVSAKGDSKHFQTLWWQQNWLARRC